MAFLRSLMLPIALSCALVTLQGEQLSVPIPTNPSTSATPPSLQSKYEDLLLKVKALPESSGKESLAEGLKKSMLGVALERAKASLDASAVDDATHLLGDIENSITRPATEIIIQGSKTDQISALRPPLVSSGNPYLDRMLEGAIQEMKLPDISWQKNKLTVNSFSVAPIGTSTRTLAEKMQAWLWLLVNPSSPLQNNPEVLARFLRIAHAYVDAIVVRGSGVQGTNSPCTTSSETDINIFDDYALAPASCALREFSQLYPHLLLPYQKEQWDQAMKKAATVMLEDTKKRNGIYPHIDLLKALEFLNFGIYFDQKNFLEESKNILSAQTSIISPDGDTTYRDHQNGMAIEHDMFATTLGQIYEISHDSEVLELIKKLEWYGPISNGKMGEFWTTPCWKDSWNSSKARSGGEVVAAITGNPYLRGMLDTALKEPTKNIQWAKNRLSVPWYNNAVKPIPLPDCFTVMDRNINGPRAWYGRFNYAATLKDIPQTEPGLGTIMGAQVLSQEGNLGNQLMGIYPRIRTGQLVSITDWKTLRKSYAWPTSALQSAMVIGRSFSAVSGSYLLHQYNAAYKGPDVDWKGTQLWLGLPDRIVGLLGISPTKDGASAWDVEGLIRLGIGGTIHGKPTKLESSAAGVYHYGDLTITLIGHNFTTINSHEVPFRLPEAPVTEISLLDEKGTADPQNASPYPLTAQYWFLVEIRPSWVLENSKTHKLNESSGLQGFQTEVGKKQFTLFFNPGNTLLSSDLPAGGASENKTLFTSGQQDPQKKVPSTVSVPPHQLAVIVSSLDPQDYLPGYRNYQEMLGH